MPEMSFTTSNKRASAFDLDKLKLEARQKARINLLDKMARMHLIHYVANGEMRDDGRRRGDSYICLGDYDTIMSSPDHTDVKRCPMCAVADNDRNAVVSKAKRRFGIHIIQYRSNNQGQPLKPLTLDLKVWMFSDAMFNMLADRGEERGDLRRYDINLTCRTAQFQQYDMDVSDGVLWAKGTAEDKEAQKAQYQALLTQRVDLDRLIGKSISYEEAERLVGTMVEEEETVDTEDSAGTDFEAGDLDDLLGTSNEPTPPPARPAARPASPPARQAAPVKAPVANGAAKAPTAAGRRSAPPVEAPAEAADDIDFDDLLKG